MPELHYFHPDWISKTDERLTVDIAVYGATAAGLVAAIEATRQGKRVVVLNPGKHLGGLTTGGLGWTDYGKQAVIGGQARELYIQMGRNAGKDALWHFAPSEAQAVFSGWHRQFALDVRTCQYLDRVEKLGTQISEIVMLGGLRVAAKVFIDATYEGDLMAKAGVKYHVGREGNATYGETLAGVQIHPKHQFVPAAVSPYVREGDPSSGLIPGLVAEDLSPQVGKSDTRVQAYNFRICMTEDPALRIDWQKPERYNPVDYTLAVRWFSGPKDRYNEQLRDGEDPLVPAKFDILDTRTSKGLRKTDTNNHGPVSSDLIGENYDWPDGCYELREAMFQRHVSYQQGFYWTMANSPEIPVRYRLAYSHWGLCKDEFPATGGWSPQLYIREARRMIADYVLTEHDCMHKVKCDDPVGMGSYNLDSHNCCRFVNSAGMVMNEGDVQHPPAGPYGVSYRAIVPKASECTNLIVPVCLSTSHIAYGSVRMEPVFMILAQSAAVAASLAIDAGLAVQQMPYSKLRPAMEKLGQVLTV